MNFSKKVSKFVSAFLAFSLLCSNSAFADKGDLITMHSTYIGMPVFEVQAINETQYVLEIQKGKPILLIKDLGNEQWLVKGLDKTPLFLVEPKVTKYNEEVYAIKDLKFKEYIYEVLKINGSEDHLGLRRANTSKISYTIITDPNKDFSRSIYDMSKASLKKSQRNRKPQKPMYVLKNLKGKKLPSITAGLLTFNLI